MDRTYSQKRQFTHKSGRHIAKRRRLSMLSDLITEGNYEDLKRRAEDRDKWIEQSQTISDKNWS